MQGLETEPQTVLLHTALGMPLLGLYPATQVPLAVTPVAVRAKLALPDVLAVHAESVSMISTRYPGKRSCVQVQVVPDPE